MAHRLRGRISSLDCGYGWDHTRSTICREPESGPTGGPDSQPRQDRHHLPADRPGVDNDPEQPGHRDRLPHRPREFFQVEVASRGSRAGRMWRCAPPPRSAGRRTVCQETRAATFLPSNEAAMAAALNGTIATPSTWAASARARRAPAESDRDHDPAEPGGRDMAAPVDADRQDCHSGLAGRRHGADVQGGALTRPCSRSDFTEGVVKVR